MIDSLIVLFSNALCALCTMYICNALLEINMRLAQMRTTHDEIKLCLREKNKIDSFIGSELCNRLKFMSDVIHGGEHV